MGEKNEKPVFDGATLSPKIKPKPGVDLGLPIGKTTPNGEAVARHYKHAAGKSSTYAPQVVDMIYHMSRQGRFDDDHVRQFVSAKLAAERDAQTPPLPATWDQLVFLSANLTRLVIDPYREKCNSQVKIGPDRPRPLVLDWPIVYDGIDFGRVHESVFEHISAASVRAGLAVAADAAKLSKSQHIIRINPVDPLPAVDGASAIEIAAPRAEQLDRQTLAPLIEAARKATDGRIPIGIVAPAFNAERVVDETIELDIDFYVSDAQWTHNQRPGDVFPELAAAPALHVLADTVERLRHHCREDSIQVIYRGGIRGGADAGKAICLGATAVALGLGAVISLGHKLTSIEDEAKLVALLAKPLDSDDAVTSVYNFTKSINMEVTMLARACGKTSVTNMEPEDLRALTSEVSAATGVPVAGKDYNFRHRDN